MTNFIESSNVQADREEAEQGHEIRIGKDNQTCEIYRRIGLSWAAFGKMRDVFKKNIPICLKRRSYEQCVLPMIIYGSKTLILTKRMNGDVGNHQERQNTECRHKTENLNG